MALWQPASVIFEYLFHIVCFSEANKYSQSASQSVSRLASAAAAVVGGLYYDSDCPSVWNVNVELLRNSLAYRPLSAFKT